MPVNTLDHTSPIRPETGSLLLPEGLLAAFPGASFANRFDEVILPATQAAPVPPLRRAAASTSGDMLAAPESRTDSTAIDSATHAPPSYPVHEQPTASDRPDRPPPDAARSRKPLRPEPPPPGPAHSEIEDAIHVIR